MKLVHNSTNAPRQLPEEWRRLIKKLREMRAEIEAMPNPFLPDDPPPTPNAPRLYDERAEEAEAAERRIA